jgi:hypothetical protein
MFDDNLQRFTSNWEDANPKFSTANTLSYLLHEPRDLYVEHKDGTVSDIHVVRSSNSDEPGVVADATACATTPPDTPQSLTATMRSADPADRIGYQAAADKEMNGHLTNGTWVEWDGPLPAGKQAFRTKLFFTKKIGADVKLRTRHALLFSELSTTRRFR